MHCPLRTNALVRCCARPYLNPVLLGFATEQNKRGLFGGFASDRTASPKYRRGKDGKRGWNKEGKIGHESKMGFGLRYWTRVQFPQDSIYYKASYFLFWKEWLLPQAPKTMRSPPGDEGVPYYLIRRKAAMPMCLIRLPVNAGIPISHWSLSSTLQEGAQVLGT